METRLARRKIRESINIPEHRPASNISFGWPLKELAPSQCNWYFEINLAVSVQGCTHYDCDIHLPTHVFCASSAELLHTHSFRALLVCCTCTCKFTRILCVSFLLYMDIHTLSLAFVIKGQVRPLYIVLTMGDWPETSIIFFDIKILGPAHRNCRLSPKHLLTGKTQSNHDI